MLGGRVLAVDGEVGLAVAVVVPRHRHVAGRAERRRLRPAARQHGEEHPGGRPVDRRVRLAVAVVVARDRDVARLAEIVWITICAAPVRGPYQSPVEGRKIDRIGLAVPVVVARDRDVRRAPKKIWNGEPPDEESAYHSESAGDRPR